MSEYHFVTDWRFQAPIQQVWDVILDYEAWPSWWPAIGEAKQVAAGNANHIGERLRFTFRTPLGYGLRFEMTTTRILPPEELDGDASGQLAGRGRWRLRQDGEETAVQVLWDVHTNRWWMNLFAPLARPAFNWNHARVMESGRRGLANLLATRSAHRQAPDQA